MANIFPACSKSYCEDWNEVLVECQPTVIQKSKNRRSLEISLLLNEEGDKEEKFINF